VGAPQVRAREHDLTVSWPSPGVRLVSYTEQAVENRTFTPCAEFPNDNPALHGGAIWLCLEVTGAAVCERPVEPPVAGVEVAIEVEAEVAEELEAELPVPVIEIAEELMVAAAPAPVAEPSTDPAPPVLEAEDEGDDIEIVDELAFDDVVDESHEPAIASEPAQDDPFVALAIVLEAAAIASGARAEAIASLRIVLGRERLTAETGDDLLVLREQAAAWQAILRGESEDFAACGVASLDEWSSIAVARCMGEMGRADGLRREIRRRGVAAFGLVIEAA